MKAKLLTRVNALIGLILGLFGFSCVSCVEYGVPVVPVAEYGCPYATFEAKGKISDENAKPVQNIRVQIKSRYESAFPEVYTDENGEYNTFTYNVLPIDSVDIIVSDTADIYASDSVRVKVDYDRSQVAPSDHWNAGSGSVYQDFQLKKK